MRGGGCEDDPYLIGTSDQLYAFAEWYNANASELLEDETNVYVELTADIDLNEGFTFSSNGYEGEGTPREWSTIGIVSQDFKAILPFLGEFDGNGHTISGIYINEDKSSTLATGLFGYFAGYLHDLKIENSYISSKSPCTGSFAGILEGTAERCSASSVVISDASAGGLNGTGGIIGELQGSSSEVLGCSFSGSVSSSGNPYTGGIVGDNLYGHVADCVNNGNVSSTWDKVGGIVGNNQIPYKDDDPVEGKSAVIERCVNNGSVSGENRNADYVGGIVGMSSWSNHEYQGAVLNCLSTGVITGHTAGGIVGYLETDTAVSGCLSTGRVVGSGVVGGLVGSQLESCSVSNSYYVESGASSAVGRFGSADGEYLPSDEEKMDEAVARVTAGQVSSGETEWKLNTAGGAQENSGVWATENSAPALASDDVRATFRVVFDFPEGTSDEASYSASDGKAAIPESAQGKALIYQIEGVQAVFSEDTIVLGDMVVSVSDKLPCPTPVFVKATDALTSGSGSKATFVLESSPDAGTVFKVYETEDGDKIAGTATWSGTSLTVDLFEAPSSTRDYYISATTPITTESDRARVTVSISSGGSGSVSSSYDVTVPDTVLGGSVEASPKSAVPGQKVTLTPKADAGHVLGGLAVKDAKGNELKLTDNGDGTFSFEMPSGKVTVEATFPVMAFPDVDYSQWYAPGVDCMAGKGLMTGYGGTGLFGVGITLTRGELATILWRNACPEEAAAYDPAVAKDETGIEGSADGQFYTAAANWAVANKVITGIVREDGSPDFAATEDVAFEQLVTILTRIGAADGEVAAAGADLSAFLDGDAASSWAAPSLKWAADKGLVEGYDTAAGRLLAPGEDVARERAATVLMRAFGLGVLR